ncbi:MAG TPA: orotate phosphoribosyltransferase [Gemmatimonadaceae bacterium]|nr:orotate phosphoribosyltransferase [Gemmatimonadaceae bacterium]
MTDHADLVRLLAIRSARRGNFTLASGRQSTLYIDARLTTMTPEGQRLIGKLGLQAIRDAGWPVDAVGGLTLGADPIAYAICHTSAETTEPVRAFTVRKEAKTHGTGKLVEGPLRAGDRVVIVEDVITTGGSAAKAVDAVRREGATPVGVLALVDREEGGREQLEALSMRVIALTTASEIIPHIASG